MNRRTFLRTTAAAAALANVHAFAADQRLPRIVLRRRGNLMRRFPKLRIVRNKQAAYDSGDFLLHGSGPYLTAHRDVAAWRKETGKPYGRGGGGE